MSLSNLANAISQEADLQMTGDDRTESPEKKQTFKEKINVIVTNITVEPLLACFVMAGMMAMLCSQNLNLEKACRVNIQFNDSVCDALTARNTSGYTQEQEAEVQTLVSTMLSYKMFIQGLIPCMLMLFLGSWSDRHKRRKPCILLPVCGELVSICGMLCCTYFFYELSMEYAIFFEAVPPALTGGWFCIFVGIFSYVSGKSDEETRTVRIGAVTIFLNVSVTLGIAISGLAYKKTGFYGVYSIAFALFTIGLIYGFVVIKDDERIEKLVDEKKDGFFKDFFNFKHIKSTLSICFKEGPNNRKKKILGIMVLVMMTFGPMHGEMNVLYLYTRKKFGWNEMSYSAYNTFHFIVMVSGTLFSITFLSRRLKVDDAVLGIIALCSKLCSCFVYAFVPEGKYFYIGAVVEMFNGTVHISLRSIMSKLVPVEELGQTNSVFGVCEAFMPLIYGPLYSHIYNYTILTFPGAFFLCSFLFNIPSLFIFIWLYRQNVNSQKTVKGKTHYQEEHLLTNRDILITNEKSGIEKSKDSLGV